MNENTEKKSLPEKVVRRHADMLKELLALLTPVVIEESRPADSILQQHFRSHKELGSRDRRFLSQAAFSYFRWYGWSINRLGLNQVQASLLGAVLDSTELDDSYDFILRNCKFPCRIKPIGDKSLTEKVEIVNEWFADVEAAEAVTVLDLVLPKFNEVIAEEYVLPCVEQFQQRPPTWLRARVPAEGLTSTLDSREIPNTVHAHRPESISIAGGISLANALSAQSAQFVVQDISSQCVGFACAPQKGGDWWDACAGAGGKSIHLMDLMEHDGRVLATDVREAALRELKKRARKYGIRGIRTQLHNGIQDEPFTKVFDGVLVDAPCSGWGTWGRSPDARWRCTKRDAVQSATRQLKILNNTVPCVKLGGVLVYAVCTFTQPETVGVVEKFLKENPTFKLESFESPLTGESTDGTLQVWPWDGPGDSMFVARFVRES